MSADRFRLDGRTALVTGGSGFLGRHWVTSLTAAGATVISADLVAPAEDAPDVRYERVDVTDARSVAELADRLVADDLHVDALVNNAAVDAPVTESGIAGGDRLESFSLDRWNAELAVGLTGALLCTQVFGAGMAAAGGGVIVNVGSDLALIGPDQRLYTVDGVPDDHQPVKPVTYSVIKSGLVGLTRYVATYWADRNVRANVLCLGGVARDQDPTFVRRLSERIPLARMARDDEYGPTMVFLCSDASSYMTGATVVVDGGRTAW